MNPADGSHTQGWGEMVNSSVITMATRPHLICAHYSSVFLSDAFLLTLPTLASWLVFEVGLLPRGFALLFPLPGTPPGYPQIHGSLLPSQKSFRKLCREPFADRPVSNHRRSKPPKPPYTSSFHLSSSTF